MSSGGAGGVAVLDGGAEGPAVMLPVGEGRELADCTTCVKDIVSIATLGEDSGLVKVASAVQKATIKFKRE